MIVHYIIAITFCLIIQMFFQEMEFVFRQIIVVVFQDILIMIVHYIIAITFCLTTQMCVQEMEYVQHPIIVVAKQVNILEIIVKTQFVFQITQIIH
jgi:hypothetical protein